MRIAKVAVDKTAYHFDQAFDYLVPDAFFASARPGCRVLVPFGTANTKRQGMLLSLEEGEVSGRLKPLAAVLDAAPLLSCEALLLVPWMKEQYFCTLYEAVRLFLPAGIQYRVQTFYALSSGVARETVKNLPGMEQSAAEYLWNKAPVERSRLLSDLGLEPTSALLEKLCKAGVLTCSRDAVRRMGDATLRMVRLTEKAEEEPPKLTARQKTVFEVLKDAGCASVKEVCYFTGVTQSVLDNLEKKGLCDYFESPVYRNPFENAEAARVEETLVLSPEQETAYRRLLERYRAPQGETALLYGVTGSGKTSVFLKLIDQVQAEGRGVILMVPEISLTPQTVSIFHRRYGAKVAVFHSGLSMGERMDEWKRVRDGEAPVVVGTRSAVFAPLNDVGLIILDEEQEHTYQSEQSPRYHAREVARFRCGYHKGLLLLASATPSIETYDAAVRGRIGLENLTARYGEAVLPEVALCDMNEELQAGNTTVLSRALLTALEENLSAGRQSILLLNRRGYNTFASCRSCGHVLSCPNCSISLTYHRANGRLMCHYCGYSVPLTKECPECHEESVRFGGSGTQKAEDQLAELLPGARILRLDADATMSRYSYERKLAQFQNREYDVIVGTQMVAKGLDFENVTVAGVLSADQMLYSDDFRSYERAFSMLTQVVGRAGRGGLRGRAFIQTYTPENPVFRMAEKQDFNAFYESEIPLRKALLYPPFSDLCVVGFVSLHEEQAQEGSRAFLAELGRLAGQEYRDLPLRVLNPSPAAVVKVGGKYRYKLIIKCRSGRRFRELLARLLTWFGRDPRFRLVTAFAQMNPDYVL